MTGSDLVTNVRLAVMQITRDRGHVPDADGVSQALEVSKAAVVEAFQQLHDGHIFVLEPGSPERIRMANPFSSVPTPFTVRVGERSWWGNCVWDALGILAAIGEDGVVETTCPDCGQPELVRVVGSKLRDASGIAYIGLPARSWWDDIIYT